MTRFLLLFLFVAGCLSVAAQTDSLAKPVKAADLDYRKDGNGYLLVLKAGQPVIAIRD